MSYPRTTTASRYSLGATIVLSSDLDGPELFPQFGLPEVLEV